MAPLAIDDPMLALIARFAGCCEEAGMTEEEFLRGQLREISAYVEGFPVAERQERAIEWITRYAERYRRSWEKRLVIAQAPSSRCPDCPLERQKGGDYCEIHNRWLEILRLYINRTTSSREYVQETLILLQDHKDRLHRVLAQ